MKYLLLPECIFAQYNQIPTKDHVVSLGTKHWSQSLEGWAFGSSVARSACYLCFYCWAYA